MDLFYGELGAKKSSRIRLAVMDMWKAFQNSAAKNAPQASILFDKFHVMKHLGEALDEVRKSEYACVRPVCSAQSPEPAPHQRAKAPAPLPPEDPHSEGPQTPS